MSRDVLKVATEEARKKSSERRKSSGKSEKKRKRQESEDGEASLMRKKRRSLHQIKDSQPKSTPRSLALAISPETSPFYVKQASFYLPVAPIGQQHPTQSLCAEHLSPLLMTYYPPFHAYILSYHDAKCCPGPEEPPGTDASGFVYGKSVDEYAASFTWLSAEFVLFKPQKGDVLQGYINLQNSCSLGILCWNFFNAYLVKPCLPEGWTWSPGGLDVSKVSKRRRKASSADESEDGDEDAVQDESNHTSQDADEEGHGHFRDESGKKVKGLLNFAVRHVETSRTADLENGFISIEGTMVADTPDGQETDVRQHEGSQSDLPIATPPVQSGLRMAMSVSNLPFSKQKLKYSK